MITLERLARETQLHGKRVELIEGLITDEMTPPAAAPGPPAIINEQRHAEIIAGDRRVPRSGRIVAPTRTLTVVDQDRAPAVVLRPTLQYGSSPPSPGRCDDHDHRARGGHGRDSRVGIDDPSIDNCETTKCISGHDNEGDSHTDRE